MLIRLSYPTVNVRELHSLCASGRNSTTQVSSVSAFLRDFPGSRLWKQLLVVVQDLEHAVRLELTHTGFAIPRLSRLATRAYGTEGEIRTLESSLEDSHVSSYITSAGSADNDGPRLWWWGENL